MSVLRSSTSRPSRCRSVARAAVSVAVLLAALAAGAEPGRAALLRLRTECRCRGAVVTLGDVAEIVAADPRQADALAAVELFPAPPDCRQRFVRLREIQDLLLLRGVDLSKHEFSGSSRVTVSGSGKTVEEGLQGPLLPSAVRAANRRMAESVVQYLQEYVSADPPWEVEVELASHQARLAVDPSQAISVSGGGAPWTGPQRFQATIDTPSGPVRFPLDARVGISPARVVAVRPLPRGTVVRTSDVELRRGVPENPRSAGFNSLDEVIGKETTCAISEGKVLGQESVRAPLLVRRGDVVTVYVRSPGICVRTLGRARDNGSLGEVLAVESLADRSTYYARVSNVREVEVYARAAKADRANFSGLPSAVQRQTATAENTYPNRATRL